MRKTAFMMAAVLLVLGAAAMAGNQFGVADKRHVTFHDPAYVGSTLLPAGEYEVIHEMKGNDHIMVFTKVGGKPAEARVKCSLVPLKSKARDTELQFRFNENKQRVLSRMVFRGDRAEHNF